MNCKIVFAEDGRSFKVTCTSDDPKVSAQELYDLEREMALKFYEVLRAVAKDKGGDLALRSLTMVDDHEAKAEGEGGAKDGAE